VRMRAGHPFSMVVLDLNGFKQINDTHGHAAGDALLAAFSRELKGQFRALDAVGRWGGDEFVVLLDCPAPEAASRMEPVHRWVLGEYPLPGAGRVTIGAATGIAEWRPGRTAAELFSQADQAMYGNKRR
jgi:diguanylate cyclase (GGDEF)-like protein